MNGGEFTDAFMADIHESAAGSVRSLTAAIMTVYPFLGVKASKEEHALNQVFRDYFTATQHHIFTR